MNSTLRNAAVVAALAALGFSTSASAATVSVEAKAEILTSLSLTKDAAGSQSLNFGKIAHNGGSGTVTLTPATGAISCTAGLVCDATGGSPNFDLTGAAGYTVGITVPTTISLTGPGAPMSATVTTNKTTVVLTGGTGTFDLGGTLTVNAAQVAGNYSATFNVTAVYQ